MKITEALLAEHVVFHNLFDHVEKIAPTLKNLGEIKSIARLLEAMLTAHSEIEDQFLIEPLEHCFEQLGQRDTFHQEHQVIDRHLVQVQSSRRINDARRGLLEAVLASRKHFDKEERLVFPLAETLLKQQTLTRLGNRWIRAGNS
ncbi:MAG: hemerythrin domain-containing protein [Verrucomicrobia bacterium]|nr:hemerythrin domain-containing protein [Verrucomicrobiota bacterium]